MRKLLAVLMVLVVATTMIFAQAEQETIVCKYADNHDHDYPTVQAARYFAELVEEKTNGKIHIDVYDGGQLGDEKSIIEQLQMGAMDFTRVSISPLAEFEKSLDVLQLPYLYKSGEQMWKVLDGEIGAKFLASVQPQGLIGLSWYDGGSRNFYNSVRPVEKLEDLKGLKIRVQESQLMMGMIKCLGAVATPMPFGEVYSALQTGVIDGAENNWPSYDEKSHFEVAKYFVLDQHTRVPEMQMCSEKTWAKFTPDQQAIIRECAHASALKQRELWAEKEKVSEKKVRELGSVITELLPGEIEKFQAAMDPLYDEIGKDFADVIEAIRNTK